MRLNTFFFIKFYNLSSGWIQSSDSWAILNQFLWFKRTKIAFIFMDKSIYYLKKSIFLLNSIINGNSLIVFFSSNVYYFYDLKKKRKIPCGIIESESLKGSFSNYLKNYHQNVLPDLIIIFNLKSNYSFIKELQALGVPIIGVIERSIVLPSVQYPIFLNIFSYFTNFFLLSIYSKIIIRKIKS